jgi:queuine/archaeosine tRNA-ribosyltransferase
MQLRGEKFEGSACRVCGSKLRYVKSRDCVACTKSKKRKYYIENKGGKAIKTANRKRSDKALYGTCVDAKKVAMRRAIEDREERKHEII